MHLYCNLYCICLVICIVICILICIVDCIIISNVICIVINYLYCNLYCIFDCTLYCIFYCIFEDPPLLPHTYPFLFWKSTTTRYSKKKCAPGRHTWSFLIWKSTNNRFWKKKWYGTLDEPIIAIIQILKLIFRPPAPAGPAGLPPRRACPPTGPPSHTYGCTIDFKYNPDCHLLGKREQNHNHNSNT